MGTRTSRQTYHKDFRGNSTVEGTAVRKLVQESPQQVHLQRRKKTQSKLLVRQKRRFVFLSACAGVVLVGLSVFFLHVMSVNEALSVEIASYEQQIEDLVVANNAKEYDISSSVDLEYVISYATEELGMVRSNASQIVTFTEKNSEYLQQVALVPAE